MMQYKIDKNKVKVLLIIQIKKGSAAKFRENFGNYIAAHREWLIEYINNAIYLDNCFCQELTESFLIKAHY